MASRQREATLSHEQVGHARSQPDTVGVVEVATSLEPALRRLAKCTYRLKIVSLVAVFASLATLVACLASLRGVHLSKLAQLAGGLLPIAAGLAMVAAGVYEFLRSQGDVYFDEISDHLQWDLRERKASGRVAESRPPIEVRIKLREFAHAAELPFLPGPHGPTLCILFNAGLLFLAVMYAR